jgi:hypothetical protein
VVLLKILPGEGGPGDALEKGAAGLIVAVALVVGLWQAYQAGTIVIQSYSEEALISADKAFAQFNCVERELRKQIPKPARVFVDEDDDLWSQRLVELSTPWRTVVADRDQATHLVSIHPVSGTAGCSGVLLDVNSR